MSGSLFKIHNYFFLHKKLKKPPSKVAQKNSNPLLFSSLPCAAQTAQTEEFMFQIVAYRPTVYRTGALVQNSTKTHSQFEYRKVASRSTSRLVAPQKSSKIE